MKKIALIVLVALSILTPISVYAYSKNDNSFKWMPSIFMHEKHHTQMEEYFNGVDHEVESSEDEINWFNNHHNHMFDYNKTSKFGCHN